MGRFGTASACAPSLQGLYRCLCAVQTSVPQTTTEVRRSWGVPLPLSTYVDCRPASHTPHSLEHGAARRTAQRGGP